MAGRPCPDPGLNVVQRFRADEVDPLEAQASGDEVQMGVVESGDHGRAPGVDHRRLGPAKAHDLALASDEQNLVAANRDRLSHRAVGAGGVQLRVVDDDVDGTVRIAPLGTDNQSGDERRRDDSDDDIGGQAGSHGTSGRTNSNMRATDRRFVRYWPLAARCSQFDGSEFTLTGPNLEC